MDKQVIIILLNIKLNATNYTLEMDFKMCKYINKKMIYY